MSSSRLAHRLTARLPCLLSGPRRCAVVHSVRCPVSALCVSTSGFATQSTGPLARTPFARAQKTNHRGGGGFDDDVMPHSSHFDVQDVDANRLTHYYWDKDSDEDVLSPYDYAALLDEMSEWNGESIQYVEIDDRELLNAEYLQ